MGQILAAARTVHRTLGPGFLEVVYENALCIELRHHDVPFQRQVTLPVHYRGQRVGMHRLDLLVADEIVVEMKAASSIAAVHFVIVRSYLRATDRRQALVLNFGKPTLEVCRVRSHDGAPAPSRVPASIRDV